MEHLASDIADALETEPCFSCFEYTPLFRTLPRDIKFFSAVDYANILMDKMYDYADANGIWIE